MRKLILSSILILLCSSLIVRGEDAKDAIDEVNEARKARGLRPFIKDKLLTIAALRIAEHRAKHLIQGHCDDFNFLPEGGSANAAGCAAWEPSWGWGSCCTYEGWTHAGAAWCLGRDGRRYMDLFVRGANGDGESGGSSSWDGRRRFRRR